MLRTVAVAVVGSVACSFAACSFYVDSALNAVQQGIDAAEGEGEGEGEEIPDDTNPLCERSERLLLVRDDNADALHVYNLDDGLVRRRFPQGTSSNVNIDNDDQNAQNNGYGATDVALGSEGRLYIVGNRFLYQFDQSTLVQQNITGRTQVTLEAFGNVGKVEVMNGTILTFGINLRSLPEGADVAAVSTELPTSDDYLDSTSFTIGTTKYAAASAQYGYVVVAADGDNPPGIIQVHDGEFDSDRIKSFGSGFPPKGIAFDPVTQKLLLGGNGRVIVLNAQNDFLLTPDASGDFVLAGSTSDVAAIAARGGFAYILLRRSNDNVIKLDLSQSPPRAIDVATVDVSSFGRTLAVGCQRLFVGGFDKVVAVSRDTLDVSNTLAVRDTRRLLVVRKSELGLAGDL